jgi:pyruvate formate lyase activating enzyme
MRTAEELLGEYRKNKPFYTNGGITATGGEPLMQLPFLTELFRQAKAEGIHTCLDTSGICYREERDAEYKELFSYLDLVLLDFKHSDPKEHRELTAQNQAPVLSFAKALEAADIPMIARHVLVPGITDGEEHLRNLGRLMASYRNLKGLEVLPYHTMGTVKYEKMGIPYPLEGVKKMDAAEAKKSREVLLNVIRTFS